MFVLFVLRNMKNYCKFLFKEVFVYKENKQRNKHNDQG